LFARIVAASIERFVPGGRVRRGEVSRLEVDRHLAAKVRRQLRRDAAIEEGGHVRPCPNDQADETVGIDLSVAQRSAEHARHRVVQNANALRLEAGIAQRLEELRSDQGAFHAGDLHVFCPMDQAAVTFGRVLRGVRKTITDRQSARHTELGRERSLGGEELFSAHLRFACGQALLERAVNDLRFAAALELDHRGAHVRAAGVDHQRGPGQRSIGR
jgi:hypothetical protein